MASDCIRALVNQDNEDERAHVGALLVADFFAMVRATLAPKKG